MDFRLFQSFCRIAATGSISAAAAEMHITQPALSRQVAELERSLGTRLFVRTPKGVELTTAGTELRMLASSVLDEVDRIPELVRAAGAQAQVIRIGIPPGTPHSWFRAAVLMASKEDSTLQFSPFEASSDEQKVMFEDGALDLILLHLNPHSSHALHVHTQRLGAVVPPSSPLNAYPEVSLRDLDGRLVMAHAVGEIRAQEVRLRLAAEAAGIRIQWTFRKFQQHSRLIADILGAEAALTTEPSALINFPGWKWIPFEAGGGPGEDLRIHTWAAWSESAIAQTSRFAEHLKIAGM